MTEVLPAADAAALTEHETVIERGLATFVEVGNALTAIRDGRLYRQTHGTFEGYARDRWGFSRPRAYELIGAADVVSGIPDTMSQPVNAGQATALARVPEPDRAEVWRETVERTDGQPTAAAVRETYEQRQAPTSDADLIAGAGWAQPESEGHDAATITPPAAPQPKRRPLPEAFAEAVRDLARTADKFARLTEDDRFTKNRPQTHHQVPELLGALDQLAHLVTAMRLHDTEASEEARRWWATSLNTISDALAGAANNINKEQ